MRSGYLHQLFSETGNIVADLIRLDETESRRAISEKPSDCSMFARHCLIGLPNPSYICGTYAEWGRVTASALRSAFKIASNVETIKARLTPASEAARHAASTDSRKVSDGDFSFTFAEHGLSFFV
jgi:hypothetical protein